MNKQIAVLIPCYNEEITIKKVINDFQKQLPSATVYVYDNNSTDNTLAVAKLEGAVVVREKRQGKGFVIASMFEDINADIYVLVDGDDTYPADKVHDLIQPITEERADMVVANRLVEFTDKSFRKLHVFGNHLVAKTINMIFNTTLNDIMSGYRTFNRNFAKRVPIVSKGFEVETQMTLQSLYYGFVIEETPVPYGKRPDGSQSKLNTFSDGIKILQKVFVIFKAYKPLLFFSFIALILFIIGGAIGSIPIVEFILTGKILHFPSAILAAGIMVISVTAFTCGIILDTINHQLREMVRIIILGGHTRDIDHLP